MNDDVYSKARDVVAGLLDGMGFDEEAYGAADHLIGKLDTAGYMVWPKREDWKRLDELEAERDLLRGLLHKLKAERIVARSLEDSGRLYDAEMYGSVAVTADEIALFDAIETEETS